MSEKIVLEVIVVLSECQGLLILVLLLLPAIETLAALFLKILRLETLLTFFGRVHLQEFNNFLQRHVSSGNEFYQRQGVKTNEVAHEGMPTRGTDVTALVNQSVSVHAAVADNCEALFVGEGLSSYFKGCEVYIILPS